MVLVNFANFQRCKKKGESSYRRLHNIQSNLRYIFFFFVPFHFFQVTNTFNLIKNNLDTWDIWMFGHPRTHHTHTQHTCGNAFHLVVGDILLLGTNRTSRMNVFPASAAISKFKSPSMPNRVGRHAPFPSIRNWNSFRSSVCCYS